MNNPNIKGRIICSVQHGSRLYKLHNDSSDNDIKQIFIPHVKDCLLGREQKHYSEKSENTELEAFSIQEFLKHLSRSEGYAIDMIHASEDDCQYSDSLWDYIRSQRSRFYTKKMVGILGFARTQAFKYGEKAERLNALKKVLNVLKIGENKGAIKVYQIWDELPQNEPHIKFGIEERNNNVDKRYLEVASKKIPATVAVTYAIEILERAANSFGQRVKRAAEMDEKDLKSLSHSFRTGYQLLHIYRDGGFTYPLPETEFLKDIKFRRNQHNLDSLDTKLDDLLKQIEELAAKSLYPEKVDQNWIDNLILSEYDFKI